MGKRDGIGGLTNWFLDRGWRSRRQLSELPAVEQPPKKLNDRKARGRMTIGPSGSVAFLTWRRPQPGEPVSPCDTVGRWPAKPAAPAPEPTSRSARANSPRRGRRAGSTPAPAETPPDRPPPA